MLYCPYGNINPMGFLSKTEIEGEDSSPGKGREPKQKKYILAKYLLIFFVAFSKLLLWTKTSLENYQYLIRMTTLLVPFISINPVKALATI